MASPNVACFSFMLLVLCCRLDEQGFRQPESHVEEVTGTEAFIVNPVSMTTFCPTSLPSNGLQCQYEDGVAWKRDICNSTKTSNDTSSQICTQKDGLHYDGRFCQPVTRMTVMPPTTTTEQNHKPLFQFLMPEINVSMAALANATKPTTRKSNFTTERQTNATINAEEWTEGFITSEALTSPSKTTIAVKQDNFTINMPFQESFKDQTSRVYRDIHDAIEKQCQYYVSEHCRVQSLTLREGSTVAVYTLRAPAIDDDQVKRVKYAVFNELAAKNYPMEFVSERKLQFNPRTLFLKESVTVTCGPPPNTLILGSQWDAEWTVNGVIIEPDETHSISNNYPERKSTLTVSKFLRTDDGFYECKLKSTKLIFKQKETFTSKAIPLIHVKPVRGIMNCDFSNKIKLECSVNRPYLVEFIGSDYIVYDDKITAEVTVSHDCTDKIIYTCEEETYTKYQKVITVEFTTKPLICFSEEFGNGPLGFKAVADCKNNKVGERTAVCKEDGKFGDLQDSCVLAPVHELLDQSEALNDFTLAAFLEQLKTVTVRHAKDITNCPATITSIVKIFNNVENIISFFGLKITQDSMKNILETAGVLTVDEAKDSWTFLNGNSKSETKKSDDTEMKSVSSSLLNFFERMTTHLLSKPFSITTPHILLNKTTFTNTFQADFNSSVEINILEADEGYQSVTVILFASMDNVLSVRDENNNSYGSISQRVVLIQSDAEITNLSLIFHASDQNFYDLECVFWDFSLYEGLGGWSSNGCSLVFREDKLVSCNCNHTASFSILSSFSLISLFNITTSLIAAVLSMIFLIICLIIEGVTLRRMSQNNPSYFHHVSIINIALSVLLTLIWFIMRLTMSLPDTAPACTVVMFLIHFSYLSPFFCMLASALLLLYRALRVFEGRLSKRSTLAIGFSVGYGAPLIISTITIAAIAPSDQDIQENIICWRNWYESTAILGIVIPVYIIMAANLVILMVVISKILRRVGENAAHAGEKHGLVAAVSLALLTMFLGASLSLETGFMVPAKPMAIYFGLFVFQLLEGFVILVFGSLLDQTVRSEIKMCCCSLVGQNRRNNMAATSSNELEMLQEEEVF
ncbi:adhesion G-protein coupled receptor F1-like [Gambusia affinis]|uniref:adhesion G-protein coupled receptor F1-like n=1 Tax=Gambusia affinis TaxID=33528 RepID=UPI001CDCF51F|nr:adhesion G-protein coupled receptor F1-like [Gambusia affinis]